MVVSDTRSQAQTSEGFSTQQGLCQHYHVYIKLVTGIEPGLRRVTLVRVYAPHVEAHHSYE